MHTRVNTSTRQPVNASTSRRQDVNTSTRQHVGTQTREPINARPLLDARSSTTAHIHVSTSSDLCIYTTARPRA
eukprot:3765488-Lingulodinium_polyedra.AAC.1